MKKETWKKQICRLMAFVLACVMTVSVYTSVQAATTATVKVTSKIDGSTIKCRANGSVSKMLRTDAYASWECKPSVFIQNIVSWSDGEMVPVLLSTDVNDQFQQICRFYGTEAEMKSLVNDYMELLEQYGYTCFDTDASELMGYEYSVIKRFRYNGSENVTTGGCENYWIGTYDAEIMYYRSYYNDYGSFSLVLPREVGVKDLGLRRSGSSVSAGQSVYVKSNKSDQSYVAENWGGKDLFTIYAFDDPEDYIEIGLEMGYKKGDKYTYDDFKNSRGVDYTILSHEIVGHDIYNYIKPSDNASMIKDFQVKVLRADKNVKSIYYNIVICDGRAYNYQLEGVLVKDARVKTTVKMDFKSNGKTVTLKNGASLTAVKGTTYKMKKGSTITLKSPASGIGYAYYVYGFYPNKTGIVTTKHSSVISPTATVTAKKKGTIYYKVGFTGTKKILQTNRIKVPGTSNQYTTTKYYKYENTFDDQIIKIIVTN